MNPSGAISGDSNVRAWHRLCARLQRHHMSEEPKSRFAFYATERNPRGSLGRCRDLRDGLHGVRRPDLLEKYQETLERAYTYFVQQGRSVPVGDESGRVRVYIFAVDDVDLDCGSSCMDELLLSFADGRPPKLIPVLALPSRYSEPMAEAEEERAQASAVHELSHAFNSKYLSYRRLGPNGLESVPGLYTWARSWLWLDEGMAVAAESEVLPEISDWLRFTLEWVDRPERSLDDSQAAYQSVMFVRYLTRIMASRRDFGFLTRVWPKSASVWDPVPSEAGPRRFAAVTALDEAIRELAKPLVFCDHQVPDVFASGFCFDSYFLHESGTFGHEPQVFNRFGRRAVTRTWPMRRGTLAAQGAEESYELPGLACRYFRFLPPSDTGRLEVRVRARGGHALKAELALARVGDEGCLRQTRTTARRETVAGDDVLVCEQGSFSQRTCDHAVLIVTNCDVTPAGDEHAVPSGYPHRVNFTVDAKCV